MIITYDTSTDITEYVELTGFSINQNAFNRSDSCNFVVRSRGSLGVVLEGNKALEVTDGGSTIFKGVIIEVEAIQVTDTEVRYQIVCKSREHYLDRQLVLERIEDTQIGTIISDLVSDYAPDFTTTNVSCTIVADTVSFNRIPLSKCLDKLAKAVNYSWYLDYDDDIHFFAKSGETATFEVTDTSGNYIQESLAIKNDYSQIRNKIIVQGGEAVGNSRTEEHAGNGEQTSFPLAYKFNKLPTVTVDGTAQSVGVDFIQNPEDYDCMWSRGQKYITFNAGSIPPAPTTGTTNIEVSGNPLFPVFIQYADSASILTFGTYEYFVKDLGIDSRGEALDRAKAELEKYKENINEGTFRTYTSGLRAGQRIRVNSTLLGVDEYFVIQSVRVKIEAVNRLVYTVKLATLRTLGIIEVLQQQVFNEEVRENEEELLQAFVTLADTGTITDATPTVTTTSPPYVWGTMTWGFFTWS